MPSLTKVREILLYSEKVGSGDVRNFFEQILKSRIPLFGFLDFSDIFSPNVVKLIITKKLNTIRFFVREKKSLSELSLLVFPYKISESMEIEKAKAALVSVPKVFFLFGSQNFLDFTVKERTQEINLRIVKFLGKFLGFGSAVDENGNKSTIISTTPEKFMMVDMAQNPAVFIDILDPIPKRMSVTSRYPIFEETGITVGVDNFDVFQHTLFVGASGTGKSKSLYAMMKAIEAKFGDEVKMVVIDPHGEFVKSLSEYKIVNLIDNYIEPLDVGGIKTPLMTQLIAQLLASSVGSENKYSERVLFYSTHLLSSINKMDLRNISLLLTDSSRRAEFISECDNDEVKRFFDEEFNDIYIHHFNDAVLPILNFVGEYELYLGGEKVRESLHDLIQKNRITVVSFNPNFFGKNMINFLAGAIINQMYILAITEKLHQPTILIVDEFQRVETKVARHILAETRKFNLYLYLSMQYLGQMSKEVHDSVISNIRNIVAFKSNRQDATMLSSIMEIKIEESFKKARSQTELEESKKEMFVRLHTKECIVRLFDGKKYILPMKLKVVDVAKWGYKEVAPPEYKHLAPLEHKAGYNQPGARPAPVPPEEHDVPPEEPPQRYSYSQGAQKPPSRRQERPADETELEPEEETREKKASYGPEMRKGDDWSSFKLDKDFESPSHRKRKAIEEEPEATPEEERTEPEQESEEQAPEEGTSFQQIEHLLRSRKARRIEPAEDEDQKEDDVPAEEELPAEEQGQPEEQPSAEEEPASAEEGEPEKDEQPSAEEEPASAEEEQKAEEEQPPQYEQEEWEAPAEEPQQEKAQPGDEEPDEQPPKKETLTERLRRIKEQSQHRMKLAKALKEDEESKQQAEEFEEAPAEEEAPEEKAVAHHKPKKAPPRSFAKKPAAKSSKKKK